MRFSLDIENFQEFLQRGNWSYLQHQFSVNQASLSQSLLVWSEESGNAWLLADYENTQIYGIEELADALGNRTVTIQEQSGDVARLLTLTDTEAILFRLETAQGTAEGFIALLKRINLNELDLEGLKRSNLSEAGFSFDYVHQDLLVVHSMFREILTSPYEWLLNLPRVAIQNVVSQFREFYEKSQKIGNFAISGENPRDIHDSLSQEISQFCSSVKESLGQTVAYLSSRKVEQLATEVDVTVANALDRLGTETNIAEENNKELANLQKETQQELSELKRERQNQQAKQSVSEFKEIFEKQAKMYQEEAQNWLKIAIGVTVLFFGVFIGLWLGMEPASSEWDGILANLFAKGFLLSPIYLWLNRSIKNYTAQKHLEVINTHRQKALETFDRFVESAGENSETRHAVLTSATEAIFDANQTGYLSTKSGGSDSKSPVQQVIREIIPDRSPPKN